MSLIGALLSKETSAVVPLILVGYCMLIERQDVRSAIWRTLSLWIIVVTWLVLHPTLLLRLTHRSPVDHDVLVHGLPAHMILLKTILAMINLDIVPKPTDFAVGDVLRVILSAAVIGVLVVWSLNRPPTPQNAEVQDDRTWKWGLWWAAAGWLPLFLPSVGWHAYYGCLGALGAWMFLAFWLKKRPTIAVAVLVSLALVRGAHAKTQSWDWGNEWYQRRAGNVLTSIRAQLMQQRPSLPHYSRVFLGHIPNNIGLLAGQSPALRVWYGDPTLQAGFYSWYRPRTAAEPTGPDFFFRFDTLSGLTEVKAGQEDVRTATEMNRNWEQDHENLAMLFLRSGDVRRAALEFEKLSELPQRANAAVFAGVCWSVAGDSTRADSLFSAARERTKLSADEMRRWVESLKATIPRPG